MNLIPKNFYFDDFFDDLMNNKLNKMKCDIYEKDNCYNIEVDIPGFDKDEIKIETQNGYIIISAVKERKEEDDRNYIQRERQYGKYERTFYLGDFNESEVEAKFNNGILKIKIPKKEQNEMKKYIEIK